MSIEVSIIMPVYNGEKYLKKAIDSILSQSFKNFELIIIDDGSKDGSVNIMESYSDERITVLKNIKNKGLIETLNLGIKNSKGKYIARMDSDDISTRNRIMEQVRFMEENLDVAMCSTFALFFKNSNNFIEKKIGGYQKSEEIKIQLLFKNYIIHPTVMLRKSLLEKHNLKYNKEDKNVEDYGLWINISKLEKISTIPIIGLKYRCINSSITSSETLKKMGEYQNKLKNLYKREFQDYFGNLNDIDLDIHVEIATISNLNGNYKYSVAQKEEYLKKIISKNEEIRKMDLKIFKKECKKRLRECISFQGNYNNILESQILKGERFLFLKYCIDFIKKETIKLGKKYLR